MSKREGAFINRSNGRRMSVRRFVRYALQSSNPTAVDFWKLKYNLADAIVAQYGIRIGDANHLIEQEGRRLGIR